MDSNSGDPKPTTARDRLNWNPLVVGGRTIGLMCPACGKVVPPSDEGDPRADHAAKCDGGND